REDPDTLLKVEGTVSKLIQKALVTLGYLDTVSDEFSEKVRNALTEWTNTNNFENKARDDGTIWPSVLEYMLNDAKISERW
ncbi:MAG: putative peptidoglycan binding domain-containing protein, partial [Candidatus Thorarchaeota archaeon]